MKLRRVCLSFLLALALVISLLPAVALASGIDLSDWTNAVAIGVDVEKSVDFSDPIGRFVFQPEEDGRYDFYSTTKDYRVDPAGVVYNSEGIKVADNDNVSVEDHNFKIRFYAKAGETYYLKATENNEFIYSNYEDAKVFYVKVCKAPPDINVADWTNADEIELNEEKLVNTGTTNIKYTFKAPKAGKYEFYSTAVFGTDPATVIYGPDGFKMVDSDDVGGGDYNFAARFDAEANTTYYFQVTCCYEDYAQDDFTVIVHETTADPDPDPDPDPDDPNPQEPAIDWTTAYQIGLNEVIEVNTTVEKGKFIFVAPKAGKYEFYSFDSDSNVDPMAWVYDLSNNDHEEYDDGYESPKDFVVELTANAGDTFYLLATHVEDSEVSLSGTYKVSVREWKEKKNDTNKAVTPQNDDSKKAVTTVTVNVKTVNATAIANAITAAGGSSDYVTKIILGSKVKKISKGAFKPYAKVTDLEVQTKKLTKKSVKGSLKGSQVKRIKVKVAKKAKTNKKYKKKYKKIFTKKNTGKKVSVK